MKDNQKKTANNHFFNRKRIVPNKNVLMLIPNSSIPFALSTAENEAKKNTEMANCMERNCITPICVSNLFESVIA